VNVPKLANLVDRFQPAPQVDESDKICDERFIDQLKEVQNLKRFLFEEKVNFEPSQLETINLGVLNNLHFDPKGRMATLDEWKLLDEKISVLATYLSDELRQKIRIQELNFFFGTLPLTFLLAALATIMYHFLYGAAFPEKTFLHNASYLLSLIVWTVAQGGLGACAYLGTRVATRRAQKTPLDAPADAADITDESILKIRIILGCLFGSLIGLPIANVALEKMGSAIYEKNWDVEPSAFALMILPFMVGFSTNLVLAILERAIDSIRTFFGIGSK
jgi:hypothetical protein